MTSSKDGSAILPLETPAALSFSQLAATPMISEGRTTPSQATVFYQLPDKSLQQYRRASGHWSPGHNSGQSLNAKAGTGLAAVSWTVGAQQNIRVYFQNEKNEIEEAEDVAGTWKHGLIAASAIADTSIAAVSWSGDKGLQIRVYFVLPDRSIQECAFDNGKWTKGAPLVCDAHEGLAAIQWIDGEKKIQIRVFYRDADHTIQQWSYDSEKWQNSSLDIKTHKHSRLGAVQWIDAFGERPRLFYVDPNLDVRDSYWNGKAWINGSLALPTVEGAGLAAMAWPGEIRVYYETSDPATKLHKIAESCFGVWAPGQADIPVKSST